MDKENVAHTYSGILTFKKEWNPTIYDNVVESRRQAKWNKPVSEGQIVDDPTYSNQNSQNQKQRIERWMSKAKGIRNGLLNSYNISVVQDE